jgi:hypothetical protein
MNLAEAEILISHSKGVWCTYAVWHVDGSNRG